MRCRSREDLILERALARMHELPLGNALTIFVRLMQPIGFGYSRRQILELSKAVREIKLATARR